MFIEFNVSFTLDPNLILGEDLVVTIAGPKSEYNYTYEIANMDELTSNGANWIGINVTYHGQFFGYDLETLVVDF